jgi:hypothetical protein
MIGGSSKFFVSSGGNIGMGTTSPGAPLEVSNAIAGNTGTIFSTTHSDTAASGVLGRRARGTGAAPTAVLNGDALALFAGRGHTGAGFGIGQGGMRVAAAEDWTATAQGTAVQFQTTPLGSTTPINRMRLDPSGNLGIGVFSPSAAVEVVRETGTPLEVHLTRYGGSSSSGEPNMILRTARGTAAAPTAIQEGDELGGYGMTGYGDTDFGEGNAGIAAFAAENWTDTAQGTFLALWNTPLGTIDAQPTLITAPNGNTGIGLPVVSEFPIIADRLEVFGDIRVGTTGTNGCLKRFDGTGIAGTCTRKTSRRSARCWAR